MDRDSLGKYLAIISKYWGYKINSEVSRFNINKTQVEILGVLFFNQGVSQNQLGEKLLLDKITITKNLKGLLHEGYVEKRPSAMDRRVNRLFITPRGYSIGDELKEVVLQGIDSLTQGFSPSEKQLAGELLERMACNIYEDVCGNEDGNKSRSPEVRDQV